jgi:hypothetical protein
MKLKSIFTELFDDEDVSDEAIYVINEFLNKLAFEFESKAYCRINAHLRQKEEDLKSNQIFTGIDDPFPF